MEKFEVFNRSTKTTLFLLSMSIAVNFGTSYNVKSEDGDPYFLSTDKNVTVQEGDLARLKCSVANLGTKMVVWRKIPEEFPLTIGAMTFPQFDEMSVDHSKMSPTSSKWDLLIKSVKPSHSGMYECQITANHHIAQYISLNVKEGSAHRAALKLSGTKFVTQGDTIHLKCNATGSARAPEAIDWFFEGQRVYPSSPEWRGRVEILKHQEGNYFISDLIIERSTVDDKGDYVCQSSDLTVDSLKVHILSAEKENISRRVSGNEAQSGGQMNTAPDNSANLSRTKLFYVLLFVIISFVWR
ncbi:hypothetical protein ACF0H5_013641 [Mactra antiquata]